MMLLSYKFYTACLRNKLKHPTEKEVTTIKYDECLLILYFTWYISVVVETSVDVVFALLSVIFSILNVVLTLVDPLKYDESIRIPHDTPYACTYSVSNEYILS